PGVLANDVSNGHGSLTPVVDHVSFGVSSHPYTLSGSGALTFRATQPGTGVITYHVKGSDGSVSAPSTATIVISSTPPSAPVAWMPGLENRAPHAGNDFALSRGNPSKGNVLANDSDPDGDPLRLTSSGKATYGSAHCQASGQCVYDPGRRYDGHDSF